ncbi:MAG: replication restart helicase PriA [Candidatus Bipolaricaulota bacterium]
MTQAKIAKAAVLRPVEGPFDYQVPSQLAHRIKVGSLCKVPFHNGHEKALITEFPSSPSYEGDLQAVEGLLLDDPLDEPYLELADYLAKRTFQPLGSVLRRMIPRELETRPRSTAVLKLPLDFQSVIRILKQLGRKAPQQRSILEYLLTTDGVVERGKVLEEVGCSASPLRALIDKGIVEQVYLRSSGYTPRFDFTFSSFTAESPSGKVSPQGHCQFSLAGGRRLRFGFYREDLNDRLDRGSVLLLSPDIFHAEELGQWLRRVSSGVVVTYHSGLTTGEQAALWRDMLKGKVDVVVGVRKAVFAPLPDLQAIYLDQALSSLYTPWDQGSPYDILQVAKTRAQLYDIPVYCGDVLPSVSDYHRINRSDSSAYHWAVSPAPDQQRSLVRTLVSMDDLPPDSVISEELGQAISENLERGDLTVLVGAARGYSSAMVCRNCGTVLRCPSCDSPLIYHQRGAVVRCYHCGTRSEEGECRECGSGGAHILPGGISRAQEQLNNLFPEARIELISPEKTNPTEYLELLEAFNQGEIDVLLGTEMIASDFLSEDVSLMALLDYDFYLSRRDYRAGEFALAKLYRAYDRVTESGRIVLQTRNPDQEPIPLGLQFRWKGFYRSELEHRSLIGYPPFTELATVVFSGEGFDELLEQVASLREGLEEELQCQIRGPQAARPPRSGERYRVELLVKAKSSTLLRKCLKKIVHGGRSLEDSNLSVEVSY